MSQPLKIAKREPADPTRLQSSVFAARLIANRVRRTALNLLNPVDRLVIGDPGQFLYALGECRAPLWSETDPRERRLQLGKVQNLRLVASRLDRVVIPKGGVFSFWSLVGRPGASRGFVAGRQIQEGCVIPAIAGGICQLSNALYDVALKSGCEIIERHAHTRSLPSGSWAAGRDATVAWNHVDFRFRVLMDTMVRVQLTSDELVVQILGCAQNRAKTIVTVEEEQSDIGSCETCGMIQCWRHKAVNHTLVGAKTAWIVDQVWPEYSDYLKENCRAGDCLFLSLDGLRRHKPRYGWPTEGVTDIVEAKWISLRRSLASRRLAEQGAARQRANMEFDRLLASHFVKRLKFDVGHLVVSQTLLPFLWMDGVLGGRTFDVLMVRRPMRDLQNTLDKELSAHPERRLLGDFRAEEAIVVAEDEALAVASKIVTTHSFIASQFGDRSILVPWKIPEKVGVERGDRIAFPGPTVARKGAYELREVARELGLKLVVCGSELEGGGFWDGVDIIKPTGDWLAGCYAVVQPAVLEDQPRKLLRAIAEGIPVIATEACGVLHLPGVTVVPVGDVGALADAIRHHEFC